eukprot:TRINITY_DN30141_c0_g1_i2.p1 TRINITY_DN30141_c0_g1~~TRINITY_DN30141_c0_g1_i2.p1  ORF type:complete len:551 (+),score=19.56 TRINITY_DN30141_c0_g1_i2:68-1720(+)
MQAGAVYRVKALDVLRESAVGRFLSETWASLWRSQGYGACDGIRSLAMLRVILFHSVAHFLDTTSALGGDSSIGKRLYHQWKAAAFPMSGDVGVDAFLVLSGFLLGSSLLRDSERAGGIGWCKFYMRRYFRIVPAYALCILVAALSNMPNGSREACPKYWWAHMTFISNFYPEWQSYLGPAMCAIHTWSVALEFQLYLVTPPLFLFAKFLSSKVNVFSLRMVVASLSVSMWAVCCVLRVVRAFEHDGRIPYVYTHYRMSSYFAGLLSGVVVNWWEGRSHTASGALHHVIAQRLLVLVVASFGFITVAVVAFVGGEPGYLLFHSHFGSMYAEKHRTLFLLHSALLRPIYGLAVSSLLVLSVTDQLPFLNQLLSFRFWRPWAALSYSMYLLQYVGMGMLLTPLLDSWMAQVDGQTMDVSVWAGRWLLVGAFLLAVIGTAPLAFLSYAFVERPGILLGKRLIDCTSGFRGGFGLPSQQTPTSSMRTIESMDVTARDSVSITDEPSPAMPVLLGRELHNEHDKPTEQSKQDESAPGAESSQCIDDSSPRLATGV